MCMRIRDFGIGDTGGNDIANGKGVGINSMRERMAALGGALNIRAFDGGTVVTAVTRVSQDARDYLSPKRPRRMMIEPIRVQ